MNAETCRQIMYEENLTCVVGDENGVIYKSDAKGITPMLELLEMCRNEGAKSLYQSDRILGKAAAIIAMHCGVKEIYSDVVSSSAMEITERNGIAVSYGTLVEMILDRSRQKEGPFETALRNIDENDFETALEIIRNIRAQMTGNK